MALFAAISAPILIGLGLRWSAWQMLLLAMLPWPVMDWLVCLQLLPSRRQAFDIVLLLEIVVAVAICIVRLRFLLAAGPMKWHQRLSSRLDLSSLRAVLMPALLVGLGLLLRGTLVEYPSDPSVYYSNFAIDHLGAQSLSPFSYNSGSNWHYSGYAYLLGLPENLGIGSAGLIVALSSFLAVLSSTQLCWRLGRDWRLCWLCALLLLVGLGNQSFSYVHNSSLNGTITGLALVLAGATPLFQLLARGGGSIWQRYWPLLLLLGTGFLAGRAHGLNNFYAINVLVAAVVALLWLQPSRWARRICGGLALASLALLHGLPFRPEVAVLLNSPHHSVLHSYSLAGHRLLFMFPSMANSFLEIGFVAAVLLAALTLARLGRSRKESGLNGVVVVLALLPLLVLAEWLLPFINDLVFKLMDPEAGSRLYGTSLFWLSIPLLLQNWRRQGATLRQRWIPVFLSSLLILLMLPIHVGRKINLFHSKLPHLILPMREIEAASPDAIEPVLPLLRQLCASDQRLSRQFLLSDPFVGLVMQYRQCMAPYASRNFKYFDITAAEQNQYPGLKQALASPGGLDAWLRKNTIGVIVFRDPLPVYVSATGMATRHWPPALVSNYGQLALNHMNPQQLESAGFRQVSHQEGFRVYVRS